jgi:ATP-binding cassette subfamily B protein
VIRQLLTLHRGGSRSRTRGFSPLRSTAITVSGVAADLYRTYQLQYLTHGGRQLLHGRGRLIEHGRHDELTAHRGTYFELFTLQATAYAESPDTAGNQWGR